MLAIQPTALLLSEVVDPNLRPDPGSGYVMLALTVAVALLGFSMVRHLRRAQRNLGSDAQSPSKVNATEHSDH